MNLLIILNISRFTFTTIFSLYFVICRLFKEPEVDDGSKFDLKFKDPDEEGLVEFLCTEKNFAEDRVRNGIKKILTAKGKSKQGRLDTFFKVLPSANNKSPAPAKRKSDSKTSAKGHPSKRGKK